MQARKSPKESCMRSQPDFVFAGLPCNEFYFLQHGVLEMKKQTFVLSCSFDLTYTFPGKELVQALMATQIPPPMATSNSSTRSMA